MERKGQLALLTLPFPKAWLRRKDCDLFKLRVRQQFHS